MHIICLTPLAPGVYNDHKADHITAPPEGWAMIPAGFPLPATFPRLGSITAEVRPFLCEENTLDGGRATREISVLTVTEMTEGTVPEAQPEIPTQLDRLEAQLTYTAMMTDTLLEV